MRLVSGCSGNGKVGIHVTYKSSKSCEVAYVVKNVRQLFSKRSQ